MPPLHGRPGARARIAGLLLAGSWAIATAQTALPVPSPAALASDSASDSAAVPDTVHYRSLALDYDLAVRRLLLSGQARLEYRGTVLTADTLAYDQESGVLEAWGNPDVQDPSLAPFQGERLKYSLRTREGALEQGRSYQSGDYYRGDEIRRRPDKSLHVFEGDYCQCSGVDGEPDYWFSSSRMLVEPGKLAVAAPVVLNIAEVPVVAAPFVMFPLGKDRRSGVLAPKLRGDQVQGFSMDDLGFYWGASDYTDLTLSTDVKEGSEGRFDRIAGTAALRYRLRYWLDGNLSYTNYLNELGGAGSGWELSYAHDQQLLPKPDVFTLKGSGSLVSSRTIRSDNALTSDEVLNQTANANLQLQYRWKQASLTASATQNANLKTGLRTRELPRLGFQTSGQLFPSSDDESMLSALRYAYEFRASDYADRERDSGADTTPRPRDLEYQGASQTGTLSASRTVLQYLNLSAQLSAQHHWSAYSYSEPDAGDDDWRSWDSDHWDPDQFWKWNLGASASTNLYGIWMPRWGRFGGLRHTLTPSVGYTFYPSMDSARYMVLNPKLSQSSGQAKAQVLDLGLGQKIDLRILSPRQADTAKAQKPEAYSLLTLSTGTAYDFEKEVQPWSDLSTSFNTGVLRAIQLSGTVVQSLYDQWGSDSTTLRTPMLKSWSVAFSKQLRVSGGLADGFRYADEDTARTSPWSASLDYSYTLSSTRVSRGVFRQSRSQGATFGAQLAPTRAWKATWSSTFNFDEGRFVSHNLDFTRGLGCWDINFGWVPVGAARGWSFQINVRDLPDIKIQARSTSIHGSSD